MDVFDLRDRLVADYASYTRSFIKIEDPRISARVESDLNAGAFWPEPLLQLNPILVSYVAKGLLPYHGLGSGIKRALEQWPQIDFTDDREGCLFTATVSRTVAASSGESSVKSSGKTEEQILGYLSEKAEMTIPDVAEALGLSTGAVEKQIAKLRKGGRLRRVGSRKAGRWEVLGWMKETHQRTEGPADRSGDGRTRLSLWQEGRETIKWWIIGLVAATLGTLGDSPCRRP